MMMSVVPPAPASPLLSLSPSTGGNVEDEEYELDSSFDSMNHRRKKLFGHKLSVVTIDSKDYLIGVQIATVLQRETFNMYRSMKIKQIDLLRASPEQVEALVRVHAVRCGTHSVTFVPYEQGLTYVSESREKQEKIEKCGFSKLKTKSWTSVPIPASPHSFTGSLFLSPPCETEDSAPNNTLVVAEKQQPQQQKQQPQKQNQQPQKQKQQKQKKQKQGQPIQKQQEEEQQIQKQQQQHQIMFPAQEVLSPFSIPPLSSLLSQMDERVPSYPGSEAGFLPSIKTLTRDLDGSFVPNQIF